jgi:hypothetical protein
MTIISFKSRCGHLRHFHRYERAQASGYFRERLLIGESVVWGLPFLNGSRVAFRKKNNSTSIIYFPCDFWGNRIVCRDVWVWISSVGFEFDV